MTLQSIDVDLIMLGKHLYQSHTIFLNIAYLGGGGVCVCKNACADGLWGKTPHSTYLTEGGGQMVFEHSQIDGVSYVKVHPLARVALFQPQTRL